MALITEKPVAAFDLAQIRRGYLLWGRHRTWNEGKAGFVTSATDGQLVIQYCPGIRNVTNHFIIPVSEAVDGQWEIRWSPDMAEVQEYGMDKGDEKQEEEGAGMDDTGGIDL